MRPGALALSLFLLSHPAEAQEKFALQLLHFNVQYVCGGTIGFLPGEPVEELELDGAAIEDRIIVESFEPVVDLFAAHPSWGVDLEMQAYMLDAIAARHPALLDKLRALATSGQIDVLSFHYSDQLFVGYPAADWERSQALAAETFERHGVPLSRTVFCQEGQAAPAMAEAMHERGYRTMVWPKNLWSFQHGEFDAAPLYRFGDVFMVAGGKGVSRDGIEVTWTFLDDGELLATGDFDPYFVEFFVHDPAAVAEYEARLIALEERGYRIATVDQYVEAVMDSVEPTPAPPLLDGTWQPSTTVGVKRWLGGVGLWTTQERDNHVRTLGALAHRELVAAETMASRAPLQVRERLDAAWRLLFLGQVTDATGINPYRGEVEYGIAHLSEATRIAREVIVEGKEALGLASVLVDPASGTVSPSQRPDGFGPGSEAPALLALQIESGDRAVTQRWERLGEGHHRVVLDFSGGGEAGTYVAVRFPGVLEDELVVSLALDDETPAVVRRSDFSFESFHFALPTGLIGLGAGRFLIKDMAQVHLAAGIARDEGSVLFEDETVPEGEAQRWVFHLFDGSVGDAAALARALNTERRLVR